MEKEQVPNSVACWDKIVISYWNTLLHLLPVIGFIYLKHLPKLLERSNNWDGYQPNPRCGNYLSSWEITMWKKVPSFWVVLCSVISGCLLSCSHLSLTSGGCCSPVTHSVCTALVTGGWSEIRMCLHHEAERPWRHTADEQRGVQRLISMYSRSKAN